MKLLSFIHLGRETWGAVVGDQVVDLGRAMPQHATLADYIGSGDYLRAAEHVEGKAGDAKLADITFLPVIPRPRRSSARCATTWTTTRRCWPPACTASCRRSRRSSCACGARSARTTSPSCAPRVRVARLGGRTGRRHRQAGPRHPESEAYAHVAGYACYNDASVREWQFHAKQIASGKNFESTGGFGPWMVTADEIAPGRELKLEVRLNGETVQSSHTGHMIFSIPKLIAYASTIFTLVPGDVIATGTPAGVGWSRKPQRFMKPGDVCEVEIEGIGTLRNPIAAQQH
jgi:hypothetical protein